jgi:hypothetical protein
MAPRTAEETSLPTFERQLGALRGQRRTRNHLQHAARCIGAVEGSARAEDQFDAFDVVRRGRQQRHHVHTQRRHIREPLVDERQQFAREQAVEATRHCVGLHNAAAGHVEPRRLADMLHDRRRGPRRHFFGRYDVRRGRCVEGGLGAARRRDDDTVELKMSGRERDEDWRVAINVDGCRPEPERVHGDRE